MNDNIVRYSVPRFAKADQPIFMQHHRPKTAVEPYHFHPSIEFFYLDGTQLTSSFSGEEVTFDDGRFCVFWASFPHRAVRVRGDGYMTIAYISLREFNSWALPPAFKARILGGAVIQSSKQLNQYSKVAQRWRKETAHQDRQLDKIHALEIQAILQRMASFGHEQLRDVQLQHEHVVPEVGAISRFDKMMHFISLNFAEQIQTGDVAEIAELSSPGANKIFKNMLGCSIKEHLTEVRMAHAKMLLMETDKKILSIALDSGFKNLSSFYKAFEAHVGATPAAFRKIQ